MSLFSTADIAEFRSMQDDLAFPDAYRLERTHIVSTDTRGNRVTADVIVESGACQLRSRGLQESERIIADRLGWANSYEVDLPWPTKADEEDRIVIGDRTFHIAAINRGGEFGMNPVAICDERSH